MLEKRKPIKRKGIHLPFSLTLSPSALVTFLIGCGIGFTLYPSLHESWHGSLAQNPSIQVCFSPEGECPSKIIAVLDTAQYSILVMAYSFTSPPIAQALVEAHQRGVKVKVLIDKSRLHEKYSQASYLSQQGIPLFIDAPRGIAHNKVMLIDDHLLITGSFNWTQNAGSKNAENVLIIDDLSLAQIYKQNWEYRAKQAKRLTD